jgi:hypothetical protein
MGVVVAFGTFGRHRDPPLNRFRAPAKIMQAG